MNHRSLVNSGRKLGNITPLVTWSPVVEVAPALPSARKPAIKQSAMSMMGTNHLFCHPASNHFSRLPGRHMPTVPGARALQADVIMLPTLVEVFVDWLLLMTWSLAVAVPQITVRETVGRTETTSVNVVTRPYTVTGQVRVSPVGHALPVYHAIRVNTQSMAAALLAPAGKKMGMVAPGVVQAIKVKAVVPPRKLVT